MRVLLVCGRLAAGGVEGALVGEAVEGADGEGGVAEDLVV